MPHFFIRKLLLPPKEVLIKKSLPAAPRADLKIHLTNSFLFIYKTAEFIDTYSSAALPFYPHTRTVTVHPCGKDLQSLFTNISSEVVSENMRRSVSCSSKHCVLSCRFRCFPCPGQSGHLIGQCDIILMVRHISLQDSMDKHASNTSPVSTPFPSSQKS